MQQTQTIRCRFSCALYVQIYRLYVSVCLFFIAAYEPVKTLMKLGVNIIPFRCYSTYKILIFKHWQYKDREHSNLDLFMHRDFSCRTLRSVASP
jgi:hypothetical protein